MLLADFIPISVATLVPSNELGLQLYQRDGESENVLLYRGARYPLTENDLIRLRQRGVTRLYIDRETRHQYQVYLRNLAENPDTPATPAARVGAMNEVVRDVLAGAFNQPDVDKTVGAVEQLGAITADIVSRDTFAASDLFHVLHHDYATFTHSANVAFYAAMLATKLGCSKEEVEKITIGGLLHDLGKLEISEDILCKPGKLDDAEFRTIKQHPLTGFRKLARREDLCEGQLMMVYQHHERNDGKGYPVGVQDREIHPWAKMCAIVDVFEAVTSQRPYRTPMPRMKAVELIERDAGTAFDTEMVRCWKAIISHSSPD